MRYYLTALPLAALTLVAGTGMAKAENGKAQLMIVGVTHFVARRDVHTSRLTGDPLSPERQTQIADVVERLNKFHPTKVLIEAPDGDPTYAQRFSDYVAGRFVLPPGEDYQFGFRLAKMANDASIYPVDTWGPSIVDDDTPQGKIINAYLKANMARVTTPANSAYEAKDDALEASASYLDVLRYLNTDEAIRANASWYSVFLGEGRTEHMAGASYVAQWYTRNCYIFANILNVIEPGDRAVVIFGQGHEYLLRDFARLNPNVTYVDPLQYLGQ